MTSSNWTSFHIFIHDPIASERYLIEHIGSKMACLYSNKELDDWFFIRYWEGGPHLRLRIRGLAKTQTVRLRDALASAATDLRHGVSSTREAYYGAHRFDGAPIDITTLPWWDNGSVIEQSYKPELVRYGGPAAINISEDLFCVSSAVALRIVGETLERWPARLQHALVLMAATAMAGYPEGPALRQYFSAYADLWAAHLDEEVDYRFEPAEVDACVKLFAGLWAQSPSRANIVQYWRARVSGTITELEGLANQGRLVSPLTGRCVENGDDGRGAIGSVLASQIHMLNNRLGLPPAQEHRFARLFETALERDR